MKYKLEVDMENDVEPTIDQAEKAAKAAAKILPGSMLFWMISQEIQTETSTERR